MFVIAVCDQFADLEVVAVDLAKDSTLRALNE